MKGFLMLFISVCVMVSINGLYLNVRCVVQNYDDRVEGCLEIILGQLILIAKERGYF